MSVWRARSGLALVGWLAAAGCSSQPTALVPVTGRVTYAGAVLSRAVIVFSPDSESGTYGPSATAEIGHDGRFALSTNDAPGATPGWHRVTIAALDAGFGVRLPDRFRDPKLSRLRAEVRAGQDNHVDFKLEGP